MAQGWRNDQAPVNAVVEVWYLNQVMLATWDGQAWRTIDNRQELHGVTHWRRR